MGVVLGTLTTKDGQVIPLPTAKDLVWDPKDDYAKEEENRYRGCLSRPIVGQIWDSDKQNWMPVTQYGWYKVQTENLRRKGVGNMKRIMFETKVFKLFEALFKNQGVWLTSRRLGELTGTKVNSVSVLMKRTAAFLDEEGLLKVKQDPDNHKGRMYMFIGQCDKPEEEARIWFGKMQEGRKKYTRAVPVAATPSPPPAIAISNIQVDQRTMEAIIRVPLDKLAAVLRAVGNPTS